MRRAREGGAGALRHRKPTGAPPRLSRRQRGQLPELPARGPAAYGFCGEIRTRRRVGRVIEREFGVSYHPTQAGRILKGCGFSLQKPALRAAQRDEDAIRQWRDRRFPELNKGRSRRQAHPVGRRIRILSVAGVAARLGAGRPDAGHPAQADYDRLSAVSAISMSGELYLGASCKGPDVIRFLERLLDEIPGKLPVIWDGAPIHRSRVVKEWLAQGWARRIRWNSCPAMPRS